MIVGEENIFESGGPFCDEIIINLDVKGGVDEETLLVRLNIVGEDG